MGILEFVKTMLAGRPPLEEVEPLEQVRRRAMDTLAERAAKAPLSEISKLRSKYLSNTPEVSDISLEMATSILTKTIGVNPLDSILLEEGNTDTLYDDTRKNKTIGIGFNVDDKAIRKLVASIAGNIQNIPEEAIKKKIALSRVMDIVGREIPIVIGEQTFRKLLPEQRMAIIDMLYNMGQGEVQGFTKTLNAVKRGAYKQAAKEIIWSKYGILDQHGRPETEKTLGKDGNPPYRAYLNAYRMFYGRFPPNYDGSLEAKEGLKKHMLKVTGLEQYYVPNPKLKGRKLIPPHDPEEEVDQ